MDRNDRLSHQGSDEAAREAEQAISTCTCLNLRRAARAASNILAVHLAPIGLRPGQFGILNQIARAGSMTMTHLADVLVNDRTTLTRNVALLQRDGLVHVSSGRDRRVKLIELTDAGHAKLAEAIPLWKSAEAHLKERLGYARWESLLSSARAMASLADDLFPKGVCATVRSPLDGESRSAGWDSMSSDDEEAVKSA